MERDRKTNKRTERGGGWGGKGGEIELKGDNQVGCAVWQIRVSCTCVGNQVIKRFQTTFVTLQCRKSFATLTPRPLLDRLINIHTLLVPAVALFVIAYILARPCSLVLFCLLSHYCCCFFVLLLLLFACCCLGCTIFFSRWHTVLLST